ncbi:MAG: M23 family metallopeptidase [Chitinophagaceae bacterium]|nr:M23 family metallopeptidase [Oligoflexus sp.]
MVNLRIATLSASLCLLAACKPQASDEAKAPPGTKSSEVEMESTSASAKTSNAREVLTSYVSEHEFQKGSSFYNSLRALNIDSSTILKIVDGAKKVFPLQDIGAGTQYSIAWTSEDKTDPVSIELRIAADSSLLIERNNDSDLEWTATKTVLPTTIQRKTFIGVVDTSLWESADLVGMDPSLITNLTEVFAWQVDFSRQVRRGDRWRLTVEQKIVNDKVIGWGNILAAEYENGAQIFTGVRYPQIGPNASYYAANGNSLKQLFIKSPLKFGRVTSGFSKGRFHPILKIMRPHNGVDYGAPVGTPIMTIGHGTVVEIGPHGGSGNLIKIQHNGTYSTAYLHMKGFAAGLHKGSVVEQGQVIGYVGATGLATGPHLHFAFYENGVYVDPLGRKFPSADPVPANELSKFQKEVGTVLRTLPDWNVAQHVEASSTRNN